MGTPTVYAQRVNRNGTTARTDLTAAEWRKVKRAAARERLSAAQFVGRAVREALGRGDAAPPSGARAGGAS